MTFISLEQFQFSTKNIYLPEEDREVVLTFSLVAFYKQVKERKRRIEHLQLQM